MSDLDSAFPMADDPAVEDVTIGELKSMVGTPELKDSIDTERQQRQDADFTLNSTKAPANHNHDSRYSQLGHNHDSAYSPLGHNHDSAYSAVTHNHDSAYSPLNHTHTGLMTTDEKAKLANIRQSIGTGSTNAVLLGGGSVDITINLNPVMPDANYFAVPVITGSTGLLNLGNVALAIKTKNPGSVVVTVKNTGLVSVASGLIIEVNATKGLS